MDPELLEQAFKKYPGAKAVIVVNLYGTPAKLDVIAEICKKNNAFMIEDAAESLGAKHSDIQTGKFGDVGIFSFNGNKIITTSGGGMLVSDDYERINKAKFLSTQARDQAVHYQHSEIGYNYRMSNICAGIGRGQLKTLGERITKKKQIYDFYNERLTKIKQIKMNPVMSNQQPNYWLSCIYIDEFCRTSPDEILTSLSNKNIECRPIWKPMSMQPLYKNSYIITKYKKYNNVGHKIFNCGLCLPSGVNMTEKEQEWICELILDIIDKK